jgi:hypothetical protein
MQAEATGDNAWPAAIASAVLRRGSMVHTASLVLTLAALLGGVAAPRAGAVWMTVGIAVVVLGVVEFWLAARVALDAELFETITAKAADLEGFDRAMQALRLMPASKANRPLDVRIRGAFRLLKLQGLALGAQVAALVIGAAYA